MATYKVRKGDTLSEIAEDAGISLAALLKLNPQIKNKNLINPGQVITTSKATPAAPTTPAVDPSARGATAPVNAAMAEALSPAGMRAAIDKINAEEAAKKAKIESDPDVIAAKKLQAEAAAAVEQSKIDIANAKAALAETKATNAANGVKPTPPPTPVIPKAPGTAWNWDGTKWVKPDMPKSDKSMTWDDNLGWREATTADVAAAASGTATAEEGDGANADEPPGIVIPPQPGDAFVYDSATNTWVRPPKPQGPGYSWDDNDGWFTTTVAPGPTGSQVGSDKVYATDTFKNTFALLFGAKEANEPYVNKLYELTSGFYKTGSTQEEAMNLAIRQAYNDNVIPEFTKRFAGIFALDAKLKAGEAITVPTIAEFFAAEAKMGAVLVEAGLGDLATQEFLGDVIGRGKSVAEVGNLISEAFNTIDNAPQALKATLSKYYPAADRTSLAKAMLMGPEGAAALEKKIKGISVLSASETQGVGTSLEQASDIAAMGYTYNQSLVGFGEVSKLKRAGELAQIGGTDFTQQQAQNAVFAKNAKDLAEIARLDELEKSRFSGKSGNIGSKSFASQTRGTLY